MSIFYILYRKFLKSRGVKNVPKYIVTEDEKLWEHNSKCDLCSAIDNQYKYVLDLKAAKENPYYIEQQMKVLEHMLVDGYHVIFTYEANAIEHKKVNNLFRNMQMYNEDLYKHMIQTRGGKKQIYNNTTITDASLIFSRFCRDCGARKLDIVDSERLSNFNFLFQAKVRKDLHSIDVTWLKLDYDFPYTLKLYKRADNTEIDDTTDDEGYKLIASLTKNDTSYYDDIVADGRAYYYKLEYIDEDGFVFHTEKTDVWNKVWFDHIPKQLLNLEYHQHRHLIKNPFHKLITEDFIYATYDIDPNDKDFGEVFFKVNDDHVPSVDFFVKDYQFENKKYFKFPSKEKSYFVKPYIRSKLFKKDWDNDHQIYPDLYFWNTDMQASILKWHPLGDDLYNLKFEDGIRSMKISYDLRIRNDVDHVRIMFKQDNQYITDDDDGTYKVLDVPAPHAIYHYEVNITGLASNSYWVFGVFPVYKGSDPDIQLKYQTIVKIRPWYAEDEWFLEPLDFYYVGKWYYDKDFDYYDMPSLNHVIGGNAKRKKVMMVDKQQKKDVAPLLIHRDTCSECFQLDFDFKQISKTEQDRLHNYVNHKRQLKVVTTHDLWEHYTEKFYNLEWMIIRWDQMKMSDSPWTCSYVDNVHIHNYIIIDKETDNFTRKDEIKLINVHYYNHTFKHNSMHQHTADKCYQVDVKINQYMPDYIDANNNGIADIDEDYTVGVPDENFDWLP